MKQELSKHLAHIGRKGGQVSSPAKRDAARLNALKRWSKQPDGPVIPTEKLRDRHWYFGQGRTANLGLWDSGAQCFWTIALNEFANPTDFPAMAIRQARLKQELHCSNQGGTFEPHSEAHPK